MAADLTRFVAAQEDVYGQAPRRAPGGPQPGHWMWFVFPQIAGLGTSPTARRYAIASADEARAYLAHPLLGTRLRDCTCTLLAHRGSRATLDIAILGPIDAVKLRSSMTLFERVGGEDDPWFGPCSRRPFFAGERDAATDELLESAP